jgi:hypothetical protein
LREQRYSHNDRASEFIWRRFILCWPNAGGNCVAYNLLNDTVHRAAANDFDLIKPRGPRLRVQRIVR